MAYTNTQGVDPAYPTDSDAANVDNDFRDLKVAFIERLDDVMGVSFEVDDPILPTEYGPGIAVSNKQAGQQAEFDNGNSGATKTIDFNEGNFQRITLTATCTFTLSNPIIATYLIRVINSGSYTIVWPANAIGPGGTIPTPTANRNTIYTLYYNGSHYFVGVLGANYNPV